MATKNNKPDYARIGKEKVLNDMLENVRSKISGLHGTAKSQTLRNALANLVEEAQHAIDLIDDLKK